MARRILTTTIAIFTVILLRMPTGAETAEESKRSKQAISIIQSRCMDCHSSQTKLPFYAEFPIAKEMIQKDIERGRKYFDIEKEILGFDGKRTAPDHHISKITLSKLESVIRNDSMPPIMYRIAHWNSVLSSKDKEALLIWIRTLSGDILQPIPVKTMEDESSPVALKIQLGKKLFNDKRLSRDNTISCASCHDLYKGGTDQKQYSTGINGSVGHINAPTVLNSSYNFKQFWDGRADTLEAQAPGPVHNPIEMGSSWEEVVSKLDEDADYQQKFYELYEDGKITGERIAEAIAEYEKSLTTPNSRFDQYLYGNEKALNETEKRGHELFMQLNCASCHAGYILGGLSFEKMGLKKDYFTDRALGKNGLGKVEISKEDYGRYNVTRKEEDRYKLKVPGLRNVAVTYPYFHDGSVTQLDEAVRIMAEYQLGVKLTQKDIAAITAFLRTLSGDILN